MRIEEKINELQDRIKSNEQALYFLSENIIKACSPKELSGGTSYNDYDTIRGSRKEVNLFLYVADKERLETFITIDKFLLKNLIENKEIDERLILMRNNEDRALFLKGIGYKNVEIAEVLGLTEVHISRLLSKFRKNNKK